MAKRKSRNGAKRNPVLASSETPKQPARKQARAKQRAWDPAETSFTAAELLGMITPSGPAPGPAPGAAPGPAPVQPVAEQSLSKVFETLAAILVPYARTMESEMHPKIGYCLKIPASGRTGRETHFGGVQLLDDGVEFHLFPLYAHPELLNGCSVTLTNCMRGKTCFHIDRLAPGLA